jgi:Flp pilus assembly protein TadD
MLNLLLVAALAASSPQSAATAPLPTLAPTVFVNRTQAEILALPAPLRQRLHAEVLTGRPSPPRRFERLVHFMFDAEGLGMTYHENGSHTVAESWATRQANCLGFTLLFLAMAREAGLEAQPHEMRETLSWHEQGETIFRSSHVNVHVRINGRKFVVDVARDAIVARRRSEAISDERLLAHYYNNLAIRSLETKQIPLAVQQVNAALAADPAYGPLWSNAGVMRLRAGDTAGAERAYARALSLDDADPNALFNMVSLAKRKGDAALEARYRQRLARVQERDPFHHFLLAMDYQRSGDYAQAIHHFQRAIRRLPREHRFYSALAEVYLLAGDPARAGKALGRAQSLSNGAVQAAYRAQRERLRAG